jgi:hypothetical protein
LRTARDHGWHIIVTITATWIPYVSTYQRLPCVSWTCVRISPDIQKNHLENRLSTQAETHALEHISKALTDSKSFFIRPGRTRRKKTHSITSPQQLVYILHDLLLHNGLTFGRGRKKVSTAELSQRIGDFIANFSGAFPGLWDHCDVQRLFTEATPCTTSNAPSHVSQTADVASPPPISTRRQPVSPRIVCLCVCLHGTR